MSGDSRPPRARPVKRADMRRREPIRYSSLTSLLDVLFILLFAALIHAAASVEQAHSSAERSAHEASAGPAPDAGPTAPDAGALRPALDAGTGDVDPSREQLYRQALSELARAIEEQSVTYARVSAEGHLISIQRDEVGAGSEGDVELGVPLLERVPDPDQGVVYLGERASELRICTLVRRHLGRENLSGELVIIAPEVSLAELEVALVRGLRRDQERCLRDEGAIGVVVDPLRAMQQQPRRSP